MSSRYQTRRLLYGEGEEAYPYWEIWDTQPTDRYFRLTGKSLPYGPFWEARDAYRKRRQLNRAHR